MTRVLHHALLEPYEVDLWNGLVPWFKEHALDSTLDIAGIPVRISSLPLIAGSTLATHAEPSPSDSVEGVAQHLTEDAGQDEIVTIEGSIQITRLLVSRPETSDQAPKGELVPPAPLTIRR